MNVNNTIEAIKEAQRFIDKANKYIAAERSKKESYYTVPKESGALRRSSLDLTRSLAELRR